MHDAPPPSPDPQPDGPVGAAPESVDTAQAVAPETAEAVAPEATQAAPAAEQVPPAPSEPAAEEYPSGYAKPYPDPAAQQTYVAPPMTYPGYPGAATAPAPFPGSPEYRQLYGSSPGYPGTMPPPVAYPARRRRWRTWAGAAAAALVAAGAVFGVAALARSHGTGSVGSITDATAKDSIQRFLNALAEQDLETISRNQLCGLYDGITDRRADEAVAKLASAAYRKQYSKTEVTSIDALVPTSDLSAQVLFTMKATPAGSQRGTAERQGIAQVQLVKDQVLTCSYIPHVAMTF
ncbi:MAG: hypothetical protein U0R77_10280 [Mycolicibacterium insubricum]